MRRIDSLHVVQIRLFRNDEILLSDLRLENSIQTIQRLFSFKQVVPLQAPVAADPQGAIAFISGEVADKDKAYEIDRLIIESRRIVIGVASSSDVANAVFARLKASMIELDKREIKPAYSPLVMTEETTTVVNFDFPFTNLFDGAPFRNLSEGLSSISSKCGAKATIVPSSMHFRVSYDDLPEGLRKNNVNLVDKDIAIELRVNTDIGERMYFISSPVSTDCHLELLSLIEKTFGKI